jgi:hypothetical protein
VTAMLQRMQVMGLMVGHVDTEDPHALIVTDTFPLPVEGTETTVMTDNPAVVNYMIQLSDSLEAVRACSVASATGSDVRLSARLAHSHRTHPSPSCADHCRSAKSISWVGTTRTPSTYATTRMRSCQRQVWPSWRAADVCQTPTRRHQSPPPLADVSTQLSWQLSEDRAGNPWLALVVRVEAAGNAATRASPASAMACKVVIGILCARRSTLFGVWQRGSLR